MTETSSSSDITAKFAVTPWMDRVGRHLFDRPKLMRSLARMETKLFEDRMDDIPIVSPVWISGLARSGSTVLLELLATHHEVATQRYRDFPPVLTPILWNKLVDYMATKDEEPEERAHGDGIYVTSESPEAFEEPIWMSFFPHLHKKTWDERFDMKSDNPEFEAFLRAHMRKLLYLRGGSRYLAKANYNVSRLEYLLKLFPDARFIVPVRDPLWHIASLMKQHRIFVKGETEHPEARAHLARAGHFEFGLDRVPLNYGNGTVANEVADLWAQGREAEGWALQWAEVYGYLAATLDRNDALSDATMVVRYEDMCAAPGEMMADMLTHAGLEGNLDLIARAQDRLQPPGYYSPDFSDNELQAIAERTGKAAARFGYGLV